MTKEKMARLKMINELKNNKTFIELLADFKRKEFASMIILERQIENEEELASYWLSEEANKIYNSIN